MVVPTIAYPATVTIPDQQALIYYTNGSERLLIETLLAGVGTNFAWVVPLPSQPVIEAATTGLFPTLHYLFAPEIKNDAPAYWLGMLVGLLVLVLYYRSSFKDGSSSLLGFLLASCLALLLAPFSLPTLGGAKRQTMAITGPSAITAVDILNRTERCAHPAYPAPPEGYGYYWGWNGRRTHDTQNIVHPLLREWVAGAPVATKLTAALSPEDMRQDVWLDWQPFAEIRQQYHSPGNARNIALNWATMIFVPGFVAIGAIRLARRGRGFRFWRAIAWLLALNLLGAAVIYLCLPKILVRALPKTLVLSSSPLISTQSRFSGIKPR
jgi:hypothetical protein